MDSKRFEAVQFMGLLSKLESAEFTDLVIQGPSEDYKPVFIEPIHGEGLNKTFQAYQSPDKNVQIFDASQVLAALSAYFGQGYNLAICKTETERTDYFRTHKGVRITSESLKEKEDGPKARFDVKDLIETPRIRTLLLELGILTKEGSVRREQYNKLIQIKNLLGIIHEVLPLFRDKKRISIVDGACGKSYLSFVLYYFLHKEWGFDARFQCIDTNSRLINRCEQIQETLGYQHMQFFVDAVGDYKGDQNPDLLYSLHGCDTATDEAIAAGVRLNSKVIIIIPCCHFELRGQLRSPQLKGIIRHGLFEERFVALLTDALRALALEAVGYDVSTFKFVTDDISPKNTLIRAVRGKSTKPRALEQYHELIKTFGVTPAISKLLPLKLKD